MTELKRAMEIVKREYELPNNFLELWQSDSERRGIFSTLTFELSKNGDNRTAEQFIFDSIDNFKKVVIPKFVAEFLGSHWEDGEPAKEDKADLIRHQEQYIRSFGSSELKNWIVKADNFILFVEAAMNGYEVEKEKLYLVEIPSEHYGDVKKYFTGFSEKSIKPEFSYAQKDALKFVDFEKAKSVAYLIIGNVREVEGEE